MSKMISICGIKCNECEAFIVTRANDDAKRAEVAATWSKMYGADIKPSDINCEGCTSGSTVLFQHCSVCELRKCGMARGVVNCAHCEDYACEKLTGFFNMAPGCRTVLDGIRESL